MKRTNFQAFRALGALGALILTGLALSVTAQATSKVDQVRLKNAMAVLEKTASSDLEGENVATSSFSKTKVKGKTVKEMLLNYADKRGYDRKELVLLLKMDKSEIPEGESGQSIIGLGRNVDLAGFAVDLYSNINDMKELKSRMKKAQDALFEVTNAGALVGVESYGWSVCGTSIPALFILDADLGVVYTLTPDNTEC